MSNNLPLGDGRTLAERLAASGSGFDTDAADFDLLNAALDAAGLTAALDDAAASLTLLAPTDAAFLRLARDLGYAGGGEQGAFDAIVAALTTLGGGDPIPLLADILRYHLLPEARDRQEIEAATSLETLLPGATLAPFGNRLGDGDPDAVNARLDGQAEVLGNGTLQAVTRVLLPTDVPGNADDAPPAPSIAGIVAASGTGFDTDGTDFDILLKAVQTADLVDALSDPAAALTVFAPTDAAFIALARDLGFTGTDEAGAFDAIAAALATLSPTGDPVPVLRDILLYHVAGETLSRAQADAAGPIATLAGGSIEVVGNRIVDADPDQRDAEFVPGVTDIAAANGAIQAIDRVLLPLDLDTATDGAPGTIADVLALSGTGFDTNRADYDMLNAAIDAAGLRGALDTAGLNATLFAPTDAAFIRLARDLGYDGRDEAGAFDAIVGALTTLGGGDPIPLLTTVLTYHVATAPLTPAEIRAATSIDTLAGLAITPFGATLGDLDPSLPDPTLLARGSGAASNGVIQAIDRVLLPADLPEAGGSITPHGSIAEILAGSGTGLDGFGGDFDILNAALGAAGLTAALDDPGATLTLLAPTDAAFIRLATALGDTSGTEQGALDAILAALTTLGGGNPVPVLTDILSYHVIDGGFGRDQLRAAGEAETLLGETLAFRGQRIEDAETGYDVRFLKGGADVQADNGALHAIDGVLLPLDLALI